MSHLFPLAVEVVYRAAGETMMRRTKTVINHVNAGNYGKEKEYTIER